MAETNDTSPALPGKPEQLLKQLIETQRAKLLQAHAIMTCVREVLLYAEGDDAVIYAEAATLPRCWRVQSPKGWTQSD